MLAASVQAQDGTRGLSRTISMHVWLKNNLLRSSKVICITFSGKTRSLTGMVAQVRILCQKLWFTCRAKKCELEYLHEQSWHEPEGNLIFRANE
jgi:hypothetical protein